MTTKSVITSYSIHYTKLYESHSHVAARLDAENLVGAGSGAAVKRLEGIRIDRDIAACEPGT